MVKVGHVTFVSKFAFIVAEFDMLDEEATWREAAYKAVKNQCRNLKQSLSKSGVPERLFEEELIEDETHQRLDFPPTYTQKNKIYHNVLQAVKSNSEAFFKLCSVLEKDDVGETDLSQDLQDVYNTEMKKIGSMNSTRLAKQQLCSQFQRLKDQMNVYSKDYSEGILSVESVQNIIHTAIENALTNPDCSVEYLREELSSLCKALIIPPSMHKWTMQEFNKVHQCSSDSPPLPRLKAENTVEKPSLFSKETVYHSSICCDALGQDELNGFNPGSSGHLLREFSMSLYQEELENADSHVIAQQDNTFYVAFQSEPTLTDWLKSPYRSFNEGLEVQMKQFPLRFLEQLLSDQKKIVLTGFSFGGMLACYVAANLWRKSRTTGDVLESNVICITFGLPLLPMPYVQSIAKDFPKFKSTIFSVFVEEDYFPRVLRYLQCGYMYHCKKSPNSPRPDEKSNLLNFKATFCDEFLHNLSQLKNSYSSVAPAPIAMATDALVQLRKALKEVIPHAPEIPNVIIGNCFVMSRSMEDHTWVSYTEDDGVLRLGYLTMQSVEKLRVHSFNKHVMSEYRQHVLKSHIDKDPDRYLPCQQQSHGSKELKGVSILKPNPTEAAFHKYPGEHVIVLNGENLSFCRKVRLGDNLEVKLPAEDVTPRMIQLSLKPSDETKNLISKEGTVSVTAFSHFAESVSKNVPVTQEPFTFNLRQIQLAKYSPAEVILLAFMSALLEQFPQHATVTPNPTSKRFNDIATFLEEVVKIVPIESVLWCIACCDDYTAVQSAKALIASNTKIPMTGATFTAAQRAIVRLRTGADASIVDSLIHIIIKNNFFGQPPLSLVSVTAPSSKKLQVEINLPISQDLHSPSSSDETSQSGQNGHSKMSKTFFSYTADLSVINDSLEEAQPDIADDLETFLNPEQAVAFHKKANCSLSIEHVYPVYQQRSPPAPFTLQSPIAVLRDARESIASFIQDSLQNPEPNQGTGGTQLTNERMLSLVKEIYDQKLNLCTSLLGAFMEQQICIPLIKSEVSTASALEESSCPVAIGVWALFNVDCQELETMISSMGDTRLMVEIRDYIAGVLSDDLKSDKSPDPGQNSKYNAKLQFLLQGIQNTVTCSSQYISYSLERQLSSNLSNNSKFKETQSVKELVEQWSEIFKEDALSLVETSHRPLIARWLKWALLIHKLRETLAEYTCVGVTGLINSGKSQLVSKLFGVQTCVGTTDGKRTTVPLLYNLDDKVKGLDVVDFPGVGDEDHSLPDLAELLLGLIQVVIVVINQQSVSLDMMKIWLKFLEEKDVPVIVCMTHADYLYMEFMEREEDKPPEPTPYKIRQFQIDRQEKEKIVSPHPSRTLHYCCFHCPAGYMKEVNMENLKKVGIKSTQDIGDELVKVFRNKLDQESLADKLYEFIHKNDDTQETKKQSQNAISPKNNGGIKLDIAPLSTDVKFVPPHKQPMARPKPETEHVTRYPCVPHMTTDCTLASGNGNHAISATRIWKLDDVHERLKLDGRGITIAVMDTRVNIEHPALKRCDGSQIKIHSQNYLSEDLNDWTTKLDSHGTMAAFIASGCEFYTTDGSKQCIPSGVAPGANLIICRVGDDASKSYSNLALISALKRLLFLQQQAKPTSYVDIISMSLGNEFDIDNEEQQTIRELIDDLKKEEVICVAASGNYGKYNSVHFPAYLDSVISVGVLNPCGYRSDSNTLKDIDVYAPGEGIAAPSVHSNSGVKFHDGSSCATPAIAGLVALLLQYANDHVIDDKKKRQFRDVLYLRKQILGVDMKKKGDPDLLDPCEYFMQRPELQSLDSETPMDVE